MKNDQRSKIDMCQYQVYFQSQDNSYGFIFYLLKCPMHTKYFTHHKIVNVEYPNGSLVRLRVNNKTNDFLHRKLFKNCINFYSYLLSNKSLIRIFWC